MTAITQNPTPYVRSSPIAIPQSPTISPKLSNSPRTSYCSSPKEEVDEKIKELLKEKQELATKTADIDKKLEYYYSVSSDSSSEESSPRKASTTPTKIVESQQVKLISDIPQLSFENHFASNPNKTPAPELTPLDKIVRQMNSIKNFDTVIENQKKWQQYHASIKASKT